VTVDLYNERVDQTPARLAYWSHNVLAVERSTFVGEDTVHETGKGLTTIFPARGLAKELEPHVLMRDRIVGATGPAYAEFLPKRGVGLVFHLPESFMNVYRWSRSTYPQCGSEWMTQPFELAAGTGKTLTFSMALVPNATPELLRERLSVREARSSDASNLLRYRFDRLNDAGLPAHYKIEKAGKHAAEATVCTEEDDSGVRVVKVVMPREASVYIDTAKRTRLDPDGNHLFSVQVKVDGLRHTGNWYKRPAGIRIYVYGIENKHTWLAIHGEGSTDGWVTGLLPFPRKDVRKQFSVPNVLLRCYNMTGTVRFREPMILRQPSGAAVPRSFERADGTQVFHSSLRLRR